MTEIIFTNKKTILCSCLPLKTDPGKICLKGENDSLLKTESGTKESQLRFIMTTFMVV